jgi:hypothetical protein
MTKFLKASAAILEWTFFPVALITWLTYTLSMVPV